MRKKKQKERLPEDKPTDEFCDWWNPRARDDVSGADIGGHPDAERKWARRDGKYWTHRTYGINAAHAWLAKPFREEYNEWVRSGKPRRAKEFVSIALPLPAQVERWKALNAVLKAGTKPMPEAQPIDFEPEGDPF